MISMNMKVSAQQVISKFFVIASTSFSIYAYFCLAEVRTRKAYATGFQTLSACLCKGTLPMPYNETSADTTVSLSGSSNTGAGVEISSCSIA